MAVSVLCEQCAPCTKNSSRAFLWADSVSRIRYQSEESSACGQIPPIRNGGNLSSFTAHADISATDEKRLRTANVLLCREQTLKELRHDY